MQASAPATAAMTSPLRRLLAAAAIAALPGLAHADAPAEPPFKLSLGDYLYGDGYAGQDVNLRWRSETTSVWIAHYHDRVFGSQARGGADTTIELAPHVTLQPSLQAAAGGFLGGSLNLTAGDPWFVQVGWGRTDLRPYFNLNFDPNDAVTVGAGWRGTDGVVLSTTLIADDRLHTGQKHWHLVGHWPVSDDLKLTLDLLRKSGLGDDGPVQAWGATATVDFPRWFVRIARDPKQNFSSQDATRLSVGVRF